MRKRSVRLGVDRQHYTISTLIHGPIVCTGAGILSLSAGQAKGTGWIPSIVMCILLGLISARSFCMVGEACDMLGEGDFKVRMA